MRWIPGGGGVIDVMNEYREKFSPGMERSRCTVPGTNNSRWRRRRPRRLSRNTCGSFAAVPAAVKYWKEAREHRHVLCVRHPILFMSEYSKTPTLPSPSLVTLSSCVPRRPLTVPSNVRLSLWTCQNARNCQCTCSSVHAIPLRLVSGDGETIESVVHFRKGREMQQIPATIYYYYS